MVHPPREELLVASVDGVPNREKAYVRHAVNAQEVGLQMDMLQIRMCVQAALTLERTISELTLPVQGVFYVHRAKHRQDLRTQLNGWRVYDE